ncbi:MAG: hypothetical protein ACJAX5_000040 [Patiriisocius sp.]|jgi:hypothetical protein
MIYFAGGTAEAVAEKIDEASKTSSAPANLNELFMAPPKRD